MAEFSLNSDENSEEKEKMVFISSCAIECIKGGGSVLIPINRLGTFLLLLEEMTDSLESSDMKVSLYMKMQQNNIFCMLMSSFFLELLCRHS